MELLEASALFSCGSEAGSLVVNVGQDIQTERLSGAAHRAESPEVVKSWFSVSAGHRIDRRTGRSGRVKRATRRHLYGMNPGTRGPDPGLHRPRLGDLGCRAS